LTTSSNTAAGTITLQNSVRAFSKPDLANRIRAQLSATIIFTVHSEAYAYL